MAVSAAEAGDHGKSMTLLIVVSFVVIVASALASGSEAALFSVTQSKVRAMAAAEKPGSQALLAIKKDMPKTIATIVIVNNIANIVGSGAVGAIAGNLFNSTVMGIFFAVFTFLIIIFSEIIPKTYAEVHADRIAIMIARPVRFFRTVFSPLVWITEKIAKPFRGNQKRTVSEEEIKIMAQMGREAGIIEQDESKMIQRVFKLNDITADDMMTPWQLVEAIPGDETLGVLRKRILELRHSRIPVHGDQQDEIIGVVLLKDLLSAVAYDRFASKPAEYVQEPLIVQHDMLADDLLILFQRRQRHLAIVVDENRKLKGVVTLEDVLEELVGEITDEKDVRPDAIMRVTKTEIIVHGKTEVAEIDDFFNTTIFHEGVIRDYIADKFGAKMKAGDVFEDKEEELEFRIISMSRTRPKHISIKKLK